jgi:hypothetical protein
MNGTIIPAVHLRDRDLDVAVELVKWAAADLIDFVAEMGITLPTMERIMTLARLISVLGVDITRQPYHGQLGEEEVTALRVICQAIAESWNPDNDPLVADRAKKAQAVLAALEAAA